MVLDTSRSAASAATLTAAPAHVPPADPWDAPYFGAPVYLSYQPALPITTATKPTSAAPALRQSTTLAADPWDAPYFGAPVYLAYRPGQPNATPRAPHPAVAAQPLTVADFGPSLAFAPWDAPYFGGPVYFGYRAQREPSPAPDSASAPLARPTFLPPVGSDALSEVSAPSVASAIDPLPLPAPSLPSDTPRRRGWLARLFHRELYIGRQA